MSGTQTGDASEFGQVTDVAPKQRDKVKGRLSRQVVADLIGVADFTSVFLGGLLPALIYRNAGNIVADWALLTQASFAAAVICYLCLKNWGMYDTTRMHDFPVHPGRLLAAIVFSFIALAGVGMPHALQDGHLWIWFLVAASGAYTMTLVVRGLAHPMLQRLTASGYFDERVAVFGAGQIARRVHDHLINPESGVRFAGVYDDRAGTDRINPEGLEVDGKLDDLIETCRSESIDKIVIALPQSADNRISHVAKKLERLPVSIHIVTHMASDLVEEGPAHKVSNIGTVGMLDVKQKPLTDWAPLIKRVEDMVLSTVLLVVSLPIFALIAALIKVESKGPVIFRQRRSGLNKRVFDMLKFRTMSVMEDDNDVAQAEETDARVTRVGWFLRRSSLDELPQLINVLRGEMSLVGPRPHALVHDEQFGEMLDTYANRHQVKPGMTGLAQVNGLRGKISSTDNVEARVDADLTYIKNWSLWLDIKILCRTVWAVIRGTNAH